MSRFTLTDTRTGEIVFDGRSVLRSNRCPICDHDTWCLVDNERMLAICPRTEAPRKIGDAGWMHSFGGEMPAKGAGFARPPERLEPLANAEQLQAKFLRQGADRLSMLAFELGLSLESLERLEVGWNGMWTFPMRSARDEIVGFRTRTTDGRKFAIKGSRAGLFVPRGSSRRGEVWIVEGPTDTAAMVDMGFNVIGRPSCRGSEQEIARWTSGMDVVVVADRDAVGIAGAESLIRTLRGSARQVAMVLPPNQMKDAREFLNHGGSSDEWRELLGDSRKPRSTNGRTP